MAGLTDDEVARVLTLLSERVRANDDSAESFRPSQIGIVDQVASDFHQFVVGRRGVGKSMLLLNVEQKARSRGQAVASVDIETVRNNPYPDVLVRLLIALVRELSNNLKRRDLASSWARRRARKRLRSLESRLLAILADPQETVHAIERTSTRSSNLKAKFRAAPASGSTVAYSGDANESSSENSGATFKRTKLEKLRGETTEFREVLQQAMRALNVKSAIFILDDFYFIPRDDQPDVLAYLHQVVKNLHIWLKIGAVEHRLNEFSDGDPPRGLQINHDAVKTSMDLTLAQFDHAKRFLEAVLSDICNVAGVQLHDLISDAARTRLVLASGGVPRDYLALVRTSLAGAAKRDTTSNMPPNKITSGDVNVAAPDFLSQKQEELKLDASPEDVERLLLRLKDVQQFCIRYRRVNIFLVDSRCLHDEQWGRDISALSDLRFFHRLKNLAIKSGTHVGNRYQAFALDLSSYASVQIRGMKEIDFWTRDGEQKTRAVSYIYTPETMVEETQRSGEVDIRESNQPVLPFYETIIDDTV